MRFINSDQDFWYLKCIFKVNIEDFHENITSEVCFCYNLSSFILQKKLECLLNY